jgi:hypothetical protein
MRPVIFIFTLLFLFSVSPPSSQSQSLSISPELSRAETSDILYGLELKSQYRTEYTLTSETGFPRLLQLDLRLDASVLSKPEFNPNQHNLDLFFGYLISFKKSQEIVLGRESEPSTDYGSLGIGITTGYDASQTFDEQYLEQGVELRYINSSFPVLPILEASYRYSKPLYSELRDDLDISRDFFRRFQFRFYWVMQYRWLLFNPEFTYFNSQDLNEALEDAGLESGFHSSLTLGYLNHEGNLLFRWIDMIFVEYHYGQLPVYFNDRETIEAGITFTF